MFDDGSGYGYGEMQIDDIGWKTGSMIEVRYGVYVVYDIGKRYENRVYANRVKLVSPSSRCEEQI